MHSWQIRVHTRKEDTSFDIEIEAEDVINAQRIGLEYTTWLVPDAELELLAVDGEAL